MVGVPRLELGTSTLSVSRSNHLSYTPVLFGATAFYARFRSLVKILVSKRHVKTPLQERCFLHVFSSVIAMSTRSEELALDQKI